jgi:GGDEF domain-containing protein
VASQENAQRIAEVFCELLAQPFEVGPGDVRIGVSLGISLCPAGALTQADTVLAQADGAMYAAKRRGRNGYHFAV